MLPTRINVKTSVFSIVIAIVLLIPTSFVYAEENQQGGSNGAQSNTNDSFIYLNDTLPILRHSERLSSINNSTILYLTIYFSINEIGAREFDYGISNPASQFFHKSLTATEFWNEFGPNQSQISKIETWILSFGIVNTTTQYLGQISFSASVQLVSSIFKVAIYNYKYGDLTFFANSNDAGLPASIGGSIADIDGLTNVSSTETISPSLSQEINGKYYATPPDIYNFYDFYPAFNSGVSGEGTKIGILGVPNTLFKLSDVEYFWSYYNVNPTPTINRIEIGNWSPGFNGATPEESLDAEWAGATAPGSNVSVVIYTERPWETYSTFHMILEEMNYFLNNIYPDVISDSVYQGAGNILTQSDNTTWNNTLAQASDELITFVAASGDYGFDTSGRYINDFAMSPYAIAVGGANLSVSSSGITGEGGWNFSGGGYVTGNPLYGYTLYQSAGKIRGPENSVRDIPDISFAATDIIAYDTGEFTGMWAGNGTSFAAPMVAGIIADLDHYDQFNGRYGGFITPYLYDLSYSSGAYNDITTGYNGQYAGPGWDFVTGIGTVNVWIFLQQISE